MKKTTVKIDGKGHNIAVDSADVQQTTTICEDNNSIDTKNPNNYKKWWFVSLSIGISAGFGVYVWFVSLKIASIVGVGVFLAMLFFDPKRRFFRVALGLLAVGGVSIFPPISKIIGEYLDMDLGSNPWIAALMLVVGLGFAVLDYYENKDEG